MRPAPPSSRGRGALARQVAGRLLAAAGMLAALSAVVFIGVDLLPGDPVTARLGALGPEQVAQAKARFGLDRPVLERYLDWVSGLLRGDLGASATGRPVRALLAERLGNSVLLAGLTIAVLLPASLSLGVGTGLRRGTATDRVASTGMLLLVAIPEFVVAGALVLVFAAGLWWLPAVSLVPAGSSPLSAPEVLVLPVTSLSLLGVSYAGRVIRAATAAAVRAPHVEFLRLNGIAPGTVLRSAVLPAVLPATVQVWLVSAVGLVGGAVLVEKVYSYPGIGELLVNAVLTGDLPVVQALAMLLGAAMLVALLAADLVTRALTPALRAVGR